MSPFTLTQKAMEACRRYGAGGGVAEQVKVRYLVSQGAVSEVRQEEEDDTLFYAWVVGTRRSEYEVALSFEGSRWTGSCDCPHGGGLQALSGGRHSAGAGRDG